MRNKKSPNSSTKKRERERNKKSPSSSTPKKKKKES